MGLLNTVQILDFLSIFALLTTGINSLPTYHEYCRTDNDCTETNMYCYETGKCVECTNCSVYNRNGSTTTTCAKNKNECGPCYIGMEADVNFDGTLSICRTIHVPSQNPTITTTTTTTSTNDDNINIYLVPFLSIFGFVVIVFILVLFYKFEIWSLVMRRFVGVYTDCPMNNNNNCPPQPPPPYTEKSPSAPPEERPLMRQRVEIQDDTSQCANAFANPYNVIGGHLAPQTEETTAYLNQPTPIQPEDDETQPSQWSPTTENATSDPSSQLTSFTNALSLSQLNISQPQTPTTTITTTENTQPSLNSNSHTDSNTNSNSSENRNNSSGPAQQINLNLNLNLINQLNKN